MCMVSADIKVSSKISDDILYQIIHITPNKKSNLRYFMYDKYLIGRTLDDALSTLYHGDGINIKFKEKHVFRNQITIKYDILNQDHQVNLSDVKFHINSEKPNFDGCEFCKFLNRTKQGKPFCKYYKKFLPREKKSCSDFVEKDR